MSDIQALNPFSELTHHIAQFLPWMDNSSLLKILHQKISIAPLFVKIQILAKRLRLLTKASSWVSAVFWPTLRGRPIVVRPCTRRSSSSSALSGGRRPAGRALSWQGLWKGRTWKTGRDRTRRQRLHGRSRYEAPTCRYKEMWPWLTKWVLNCRAWFRLRAFWSKISRKYQLLFSLFFNKCKLQCVV